MDLHDHVYCDILWLLGGFCCRGRVGVKDGVNSGGGTGNEGIGQVR